MYDSLLIHYKWDGDSIDHSGNNYDPVTFNVLHAPDRFGTDSAAIYFNGIDHFIALPDTMTLKPDFPLTIAFWANMEEATLDNGIFFTNDFSETGHCGAFVNYSTNQSLSISYADGSGFGPGARRTKHSNQFIEAGVWYFIAAVFHNADDMRIFINGLEDYGFIEGFATSMMYSGEGGNLGRKDFSYTLDPFYFKGFMDEFCYWDRGLSNIEVHDLYEEGLVFLNDKRESHDIVVYPNPVVNYISLSIPGDASVRYKIRNVTGQLILQGTYLESIDVQVLKSGIYSIEVENSGSTFPLTKKFIKK